jgi:hypothetical protein
MKKAVCVFLFIFAATLAVQSQQQAGKDLSWAFPVKNGDLPPEEPGQKTIPGSAKSYAQTQIEDRSTRAR